MSFELDEAKTKSANLALELGKFRADNQALRDRVAALELESRRQSMALNDAQQALKAAQSKPPRIINRTIEVPVIKRVNVPVQVIKEKEVIKIQKVVEPDTDSIEKLNALRKKYDELKARFNELIARV